ncbi:MAG: hypothetical protein WAM46_13230 [Flavobacterium sp.]
MELKLNKELQNKLRLFLEIKDSKLIEFLSLLNIDKFSFLLEEINMLEEIYKKDKNIRGYLYIYIGEAVINVRGGFWSIGKFRKDEAYGLPIILGWGENENSPRICPDVWLKRIDSNRLRKPLGEMIYSL